MGRECRRVPANWEHPKNEQGHYIPLYAKFPYDAEEIEEGILGGWLTGEPPLYDVAVMPEFPEGAATHYMMYEDCTEGTPISPAFSTPDELARWLTDTRASAFGYMTQSYDAWMAIIINDVFSGVVFSPGQGMAPGAEFYIGGTL